MGEDRTAKVAVGISTAAAIAAALAWLKSGKAEAAPPAGIPEELMNLVIAIAQSLESVDADLDDAITAIKGITLEGGLGWPRNANSITSLRVAIPVIGIQLPYLAVPSGMTLFIKAWPLNPGWLQIGASIAECTNVNQSFPLLPNETVWYQVENADQIYIAGTAAGCFACLTVEQRKGGGI